MYSKKEYMKLMTAQVCIHTASCLLDEVLQDRGVKFKDTDLSPTKLIKDLLSARSKIDDCVEKIMPDFNFKQGDFINQVSYILEDTCEEIYNKYYKE